MRSQDLSLELLIARVKCERIQACLDALDGTAESRAWAAVRDVQLEGIRLHAKAKELHDEEVRRQWWLPRPAPFERLSPMTLEYWLEKARACASAPPP